jgi:hypothetical protein
MSMAARLDHEKTAAESHYCCDRNIVMSASNEKKTDEPGNAFVELMSHNREEQASRSTQPSSLAAS